MTENQPINDKVATGTFEVQYLDAYGYRGRLRIDIQDIKEGQLQGRLRASVNGGAKMYRIARQKCTS